MRNIITLFIISVLFACTSSTRNTNSEVTSEQLGILTKENTPPIEDTLISKDTLTTNLAEPEPKATKGPQVAIEFINSYIANANEVVMTDGGLEIRAWTKSSKLVTDNFKTELVNMVNDAFEREPDYGLGFDPILDAQDFPQEGFQLLNYDSATNIATVAGKEWTTFVRNIRLTEENGQTLVDGCGVVNIPEELRAEQ